jgi:hypothetical protein
MRTRVQTAKKMLTTNSKDEKSESQWITGKSLSQKSDFNSQRSDFLFPKK